MNNSPRDRRNEAGLTQADPAAALGVSRQTVLSIESGRYLPSLPLAFKIAGQFGLPIEELFEPTEEDLG